MVVKVLENALLVQAFFVSVSAKDSRNKAPINKRGGGAWGSSPLKNSGHPLSNINVPLNTYHTGLLVRVSTLIFQALIQKSALH